MIQSQLNLSSLDSSVFCQKEVEPPRHQKRRRTWSTAAKLKVLKEIESLRGHQADVGAYLRREGLFASTISLWKKMRNGGLLNLCENRRGPKPKHSKEEKEIERLLRENTLLRQELDRAKKLIDIQKKISNLLSTEG